MGVGAKESHLTWSEGKGHADEWVGALDVGADCAKACGMVCRSRDPEADGGALGWRRGLQVMTCFWGWLHGGTQLPKLIHGQTL